MARSSSTSKAASWTESIRKYRRSGLTQGRSCQEHGISYHSLRGWLRRLRTEVTADSPRRRKPNGASPKPREPEAPRFLPVRVIEAGSRLRATAGRRRSGHGLAQGATSRKADDCQEGRLAPGLARVREASAADLTRRRR